MNSGPGVHFERFDAGFVMAEGESDVSVRSGGQPSRSRCGRLLVVDPVGLVEAPLDACDVEPVDVAELSASVVADGTVAPLAAGAPAPTVPAHPADELVAVHPTVLRQQDGHVLAWHDAASRYVAVGVAHLAVLDQLRHDMSTAHLLDLVSASNWDVPADAAARAITELEALGLVRRVPVAVPPPASSPMDAPGRSDHPAPEPLEEVSPLVASGPVPDDSPADDGSDEVSGTAAPDTGAEWSPGLFEDLPPGRGAARVLGYRVVGRTRRHTRRVWERAGRATAQGLLAHFGTERDDWPGPLAAPEAPVDPHPEVPTGGNVARDQAPDQHREPEEPFVEHLEEWVPAPTDETTPGRASVDHRTPVFGVYYSPEHNANLGLGMIIAHARTVDRGALNHHFDLRKASIDSEPMLAELALSGRQAIVLCSDYMWSIEHNLRVSERVKQLNPSSIVVHGGPHAPKYEADAERFLRDHPYVDVLVRGEGELTIADLLRSLGAHPDPDALGESLAEVEGLTFRDGPHGDHRVVRTPDRARATDMDQFPSPYLTGEFDEVDTARWRSATVETNRGCPYGCTFCDWGTATNSRIRQFDRDRVFAELEWLASRGISEVFLADANFGLFARDVEVAQHIAELKQRYGAPTQVICSFAKNTVKYTSEIVRIWVEAGICAEGSVALQTTDEVTLANVERSNIKVEKYDALAEEFRRHRLPIVTDLLMGLPGATVESFKNDLQRCLDQEVTPRMMETVLLPNSPMNAPDYRERFRIETDDANVLVATSSYTREDFEEMKRLRLLFRACEHYGLMRHLFRWLQVEHGVRALDLLHDIDRAIISEPDRYPLLTWVGRYFDLITAPPGGWPPFYDEVVDLLDERHGIVRDEAMDTVLAVQLFLMPSRARRFPDRLELAHDYVAWHRATSHGSGSAEVPRLVDLPPGELVVDDPAGVCDARLLRNGFSIRREEACDNPFWVLNDWELDSELARPMATAVPLLTTS